MSDWSRRRVRLAAVGVALALSLAPPGASAQDDTAPSRLPDPLSLASAMQIAREQRREVGVASSAADAAAYRPSIVNVPEDPMVMGRLIHLPLPDAMGADWSVMVQQMFPLSDVLGARARTAEADARRLRHGVGTAELDVELEAAMAFLDVYYARALAQLVDRQIALAAQLVAASEARYGAAMGSQTEVLRSETELARLRAARLAVDGRIAGAEGMLAAALAQESETAIPLLSPPADDPDLDPVRARALVSRALDARPELAASREAIAQARSQVDVMEQMYFPSAMIQIGGGSTMAGGPGLMGMLGISVPIFRDRLDSGVGEARSMVAMSEDELAAMQRMIEGQVASAVGAVRAARAQRDAMREEVVPRAGQAVDAALAQYGAAEVPQVTVVEAMRALFAIEIETLGAEIEAAMAEARLRRAVGREGER